MSWDEIDREMDSAFDAMGSTVGCTVSCVLGVLALSGALLVIFLWLVG